MKLLRHGPRGHERPGLLDAAGAVRDLSAQIGDIGAADLAPARLDRLRSVEIDTLPIIAPGTRLSVPWHGLSKFVCVGLNYKDHAAEAKMALPTEPILFLKANSALTGPADPVVLPQGAAKADWEVELGVVIGTRARCVSEAKALSHVAGYCVVNDVSERAFQLERGGQWVKGKSCDTFAPLGPFLATTDEIPTGNSETGYSNPEYDALFKEQEITVDKAKRNEILHKMQEILVRDSPYIIAYYAQAVEAYRSDKFQGWVIDPEGVLSLSSRISLTVVSAVQ